SMPCTTSSVALPRASYPSVISCLLFFFFNLPPPTSIYTLSLHDALPISRITPISPGSSPAAPGPLIGAHMSIAGGLDKAIERALAVRARVLQIFTRNTHQWKARRLGPSEIEAFRNGWAASGLHTVVAHDCYLINLASPAEALRRRSVETMAEELLQCGALGIPYLVSTQADVLYDDFD